jgi:hypothetical protein
MTVRYALSLMVACVPIIFTGCLEHANPFDPENDVTLSIAAPENMTIGSEADVVLSWTPASNFEPQWSYNNPGIVLFKTFHEGSAAGTARVTVRAVARGTVAITAGFATNSVSRTLVVQ